MDRKRGVIYHQKVFDAREKFLLGLCLDEPISYSIFGSAHDFLDDIFDWNKKNPEDKFSFIDIWPEGILKD